MMLSILFLLGGFLFLIKGADWLVEGASSIAERAGVSQLVIGLTLVSFGTSTPELFINLISRLSGDEDMTVGNIIGSNIANILLILGVSAAFRPLTLKRSTVYWEIPFAAAMAVLLYFFSASGRLDDRSALQLSRIEGTILLGFFLGFLAYIFVMQKRDRRPLGDTQGSRTLKTSMIYLTGGVLGLAFGAKAVVQGGVDLATFLGVPESVIALSVIALGSTLPEMLTSVVAAMKSRSDIAVGNIVGSNIFNICWILGLSAVIRPLSMAASYLMDAAIMIGASVLLFAFVFLNRTRLLSRLQGITFLILYGVYMTMLVF
jgi:cation:H+ antiporter